MSHKIISQSCLRKCQNWDDCKWYTYDPTLEDCLLFESCSTVSDDDCQSCLSGEVNCEAFKCGEKGLCQVLKRSVNDNWI